MDLSEIEKFRDPIFRTSHLYSIREKARAGDQLLLFTYGFGSTWCGLILEKV